ncbi:hypothetical protein BRARA_K00999, partial [Brassica rapa]
VPEGLGSYAVSSTKAQANWLVITTLKGHKKADVQGLLSFYRLPSPGLKFELQTLLVDQKSVADGDTVTVYVSSTDPTVSSTLPNEVSLSAAKRAKPIIASGHRMINVNNKEVLGKKGIDAPESKMPFGKESHDELLKMVEGKSLKVLVYAEDRYGRYIYCNGKFVQEVMLKKGLAWHYLAYDKRPELAKASFCKP